MPKETMSTSESSCVPKALPVFVMRATRPSSRSKTAANRIIDAAL
jgi:hypothetical protein